jgi:hypothetical protein
MQRIEINVVTGEQQVIDLTAEEIAALPALALPTYQALRVKAYPSMADQLDLLYHGGMDAWKAAITAVKEEFPKP